jgi:ABC-type sugar transport system ATPase subunit
VKQLAADGMGILFISSEIEEVLSISDRILIMRQGRITDTVDPAEINISELMKLVMEEGFND